MKENNISITLKSDLCTGCGICEGACISNAIAIIVENGNFRPKISSDKCTNCGRCVRVCPGLGIELRKFANNIQYEANNYDKMVGRYVQCFTGFSTDNEIRYHSASGGMVSQFLIWLLENKKIDGAIVTKFDKNNPLLVKTFIATTKEEIFSARSSRYSPVTMNRIVQDIKNAKGSRFVVVGLPCHIQGIRKMMQIDRAFREKIKGLFALYCSCGRSFNLTEYVFKERGILKKDLISFQYRDEGCLGKMVACVPKDKGEDFKFVSDYSKCIVGNDYKYFKEDFQSFYHPLRSIFIPRRCLFCIDHYGELGDVCFGDIHIHPYLEDKVGINSLVVKNREWLNLVLECEKSGSIKLEEVSFDTISKSQKMSFVKKGKHGAYINICRKLGMNVPVYDVDYLRMPKFADYFYYAQNRIMQFLGRHKSLWSLIPLIKAKVRVS